MTKQNHSSFHGNWGTWWHSWMRLWATSQKVVGLIPHDVTGILHRLNPSGRTMALGSTQPLTEMSKGKVHPCTGTEALYRPYSP